jgi:hypothetical protein
MNPKATPTGAGLGADRLWVRRARFQVSGIAFEHKVFFTRFQLAY